MEKIPADKRFDGSVRHRNVHPANMLVDTGLQYVQEDTKREKRVGVWERPGGMLLNSAVFSKPA